MNELSEEKAETNANQVKGFNVIVNKIHPFALHVKVQRKYSY